MTTPAVESAVPRPRHLLRRRALLAVASLCSLALPGCQSIAVNAGNVATLRVIDASPDAPGLDFYENGTAIAYNIGFGTVSSYVAFAPGTYAISTDQTGTRTQLTASNASLANMRQYTAMISNVNASLQETILPDQNTAAPSSQMAVRILNESTKITGGVDVYLVPSSGKLGTSSPVATGLTFGANTGYLNVPAGTYAIVVVPTGTVPSASTGALYTGSQVTYAQGAVRTVILIDQQIVTSPGIQALVAADFDYNGTTT
jgi:hypothetical protein